MTIFLELTAESFNRPLYEKGASRMGAGSSSVRRPLRGIEVKDDTHAVIRVIDAAGQEIPLISSSYPGGRGPDYTNFILQSVQDPREEKSQILETFGESYVFFFGEKHRLIAVSAMLINTLDFNWKAEFWANYEQYLRGTKCAENGARVYLYYDDNILEGYMVKASATEDATSPHAVPLQFLMFLTRSTNISFIENSTYPIRPSAQGDDWMSRDVAGMITPGETLIPPRTLPYWLEPDNIPGTLTYAEAQKRTLNGQPADPYAAPALVRTAPLRSEITDNVDEWTGDRFGHDIPWQRMAQLRLLEAQRLTDEFIKQACAAGAFADNPGALGSFGLFGPGRDTNGFTSLKDAWSGVKGAWKDAKNAARAAPGTVNQAISSVSGMVTSAPNAIVGGTSEGLNSLWTNGTASTGIGQGGYYAGAGWQNGYGGAGQGYYSGGAAGYTPGGSMPSASGGAGYYAGVGQMLPGQVYSPGHGSGSTPSHLASGGVVGAWAGWSPGTGWTSGSYSQGYGTATQNGSTAGWYGSSSGGYAGVQGGFSGGAGYAGGGYAAGYRGGTPANASSMYYASAGGSWDPDNGFQWGSASTSNPIPGQPGGGIFTTQALPDSGFGSGVPTPYGQMDPVHCASQGNMGSTFSL